MDNSQLPQIPEGALGALLQNPKIAEKLPRIMEALSPVIAEMKSENAAVEPPKAEAAAEAAPDSEGQNADGGAAKPAVETAVARPLTPREKGGLERAALLRALAPYLSAERRAALDTVLKMSSLLDVISEVL